MSLFGGSSRSSSSSSTTNNQQDRKANVGNGGFANTGNVSGSINYQVSDHGAVNKAFDFGAEALKANSSALKDAFGFGEYSLNFVGKTVKDSQAAVSQATERAISATNQSAEQQKESSKNQRYMLGAFVVAFVAFVAFGRKRKT